MWRHVADGLLNLLWPPRLTCLLCKSSLGAPVAPPVCTTCWTSMAMPQGAFCQHCARPLQTSGHLCDACIGEPGFGHVWALGLHAGPLREAIHAFKFEGRDDLGIPLGRHIAATIGEEYDWVVPVPLHWRRQRVRGYNQAALVAQGIAAATGWQVAPDGLRRRRDTGHQAKLERTGRLRNLSGAFIAVDDPAPWVGARVLLVDDVLTTGATLASAAVALYDSGADVVDVAVLAVSTSPMRVGLHEISH